MFMYFLLPHWVPATWRSRAQTSMRAELPSGKLPTTRVRRRTVPKPIPAPTAPPPPYSRQTPAHGYSSRCGLSRDVLLSFVIRPFICEYKKSPEITGGISLYQKSALHKEHRYIFKHYSVPLISWRNSLISSKCFHVFRFILQQYGEVKKETSSHFGIRNLLDT